MASNRTLALVRVVFQFAVDHEELDASTALRILAASCSPSSPASAS